MSRKNRIRGDMRVEYSIGRDMVREDGVFGDMGGRNRVRGNER